MKSLAESAEATVSEGRRSSVFFVTIDSFGLITEAASEGVAPGALPPEAFVGQSVFEVFAGAPSFLENLKRALAGKPFLPILEISRRPTQPLVAHGFAAENVLERTPESWELCLAVRHWPSGAVRDVVVSWHDVTRDRRASRLQAQLAAIVESSDDAIISKTLDGTVLSWNQGAEKIYGYREDEIVGRSVSVLAPPERANEIPVILKRLAAGERIDHYETVRLTKSGRRIDVSLTISPIRDETGHVVAAATIARDITEHKRLRLAQIVESSMDAIIGLSPEGIIESWNAGAERVLGWSREEIVGRPAAVLAPPGRQLELADNMRRLSDGARIEHLETVRLRKDGSEIEVSLSSSPILDDAGRFIGISTIVRDISSLKAAQRAEQHRTEELARSNADLEQFAYVASHDLQEPLRMVSCYVQLLAKKYGETLDADAKEMIGFAVEGCKRMRTLIQDLLTYSRVTRGPQTPLLVDTEAVVREALENVEGHVAETGAIVTIDELPKVRGYRSTLVHLFQNLLDNAMKFRGPEPPRVRVGAVKGEDGRWLFSVTDNGIGIEPRYLERIFQIFQRLHDRESYAGNGIGLSVCRTIVERHGGRIWAKSRPGEGTTFHFTLPATGE